MDKSLSSLVYINPFCLMLPYVFVVYDIIFIVLLLIVITYNQVCLYHRAG